jgi:hypothetical protein
MYTICATKKLLDRVKIGITSHDGSPATVLGNWYATALLWKPQVALLVNERTLLPVLMPLAPAADLAARFPQQLERVLTAHGVDQSFIDRELAQMREVQYTKTFNRSVVGIMNQFSYLAEGYRDYLETDDLLELSLKLSETPCSPLYKSAVSPDRELKRLVDSR